MAQITIGNFLDRKRKEKSKKIIQQKNDQGKQEKTNLGEGSIGKLLLKLSIPAIVAQMVNMLYNMVDRIYIGHIPETGELSLTGLGLCFPIIMLITAFSSLIGFGGGPRVAIEMGKGNNQKAEKILGNCFASLIVVAMVITIVLELTAVPILQVFGASDNTMPHAYGYMRVYALGTIFVMISLGMNPFITTQGFSKDAMKTVVIGAVCNIILDPIFIFVFRMGAQGAALATILSQAVSAVWVLRFLLGKRTILRIRPVNMKIDKKIMAAVLALGVSPFIMGATESAISIVFNSSLSKYGGDAAVGAMTILTSVMQLQFMPVQGLTQGAQPITSFNYGAGKINRVKKTYRLLILTSLIYTMAFWGVVQLFPQIFVGIFNDSPELLKITTWAAHIYFAASGVFGVQMAIQQTFLSLGQAKVSLFIACLRKIILLIPLVYILPRFFEDKVFAVFLAEPIADFISVATATTLFIIYIPKILGKSGKK